MAFSVRKMPSGGRGEYEVVGSDASHGVSDLLMKRFTLLLNGTAFPTSVYLTAQGDKNRLRLQDPNDRRRPHLAPIIAALLLLPAPTREESSISNCLPSLTERGYILDFTFELVSIGEDEAQIAPKTITARSGDIGDESKITRFSVHDRFEAIKQISEVVEFNGLQPSVEAFAKYRRIFEVSGFDSYAEALEVKEEIRAALHAESVDYLPTFDILPFLEDKFLHKGLGDLFDTLTPELLAPPDNRENIKARVRVERHYRQLERRGGPARRFSRDVIKAYGCKCLMCGCGLPSTEHIRTRGIESAHIIPWAEADLDIVPNGLALCRNHHWGFDQHVVAIEPTNHGYRIVPGAFYGEYLAALGTEGDAFSGCFRDLPTSFLPRDRAQWPRPAFLERFNSLYAHP